MYNLEIMIPVFEESLIPILVLVFVVFSGRRLLENNNNPLCLMFTFV